MNTNDLKCKECGDSVFEASQRGVYLKRISPKGEGEDFIGVCSPSCNMSHGNTNDAVMNAVLKT